MIFNPVMYASASSAATWMFYDVTGGTSNDSTYYSTYDTTGSAAYDSSDDPANYKTAVIFVAFYWLALRVFIKNCSVCSILLSICSALRRRWMRRGCL